MLYNKKNKKRKKRKRLRMKKRIINFDKEAFQSKIKSWEHSPWPYVIMLIVSLFTFIGCIVPVFNALVADPDYIIALTENNRN
jgi:hypothetical protein